MASALWFLFGLSLGGTAAMIYRWSAKFWMHRCDYWYESSLHYRKIADMLVTGRARSEESDRDS